MAAPPFEKRYLQVLRSMDPELYELVQTAPDLAALSHLAAAVSLDPSPLTRGTRLMRHAFQQAVQEQYRHLVARELAER